MYAISFERKLFMESDKKLEMLKELDDIYEDCLKKNSEVKVQEAIKPHLEEVGKKYGVDPVDVFIMYLDHVAISSKKLAQSNGEDKQFEINLNDLDSLNGMKF